jgi:hypothetical protein
MMGAVLADTPVKVALGAEVEARAKPVKCNWLFRDRRNHENIN